MITVNDHLFAFLDIIYYIPTDHLKAAKIFPRGSVQINIINYSINNTENHQNSRYNIPKEF